jgi:short-subunit dehydrogenase
MKKIAITGACGGIGKELVHLYIQQGHFVIGIDLIDDELNQLAKKYPSQFHGIKADLSLKKEIKNLNHKIEKDFGIPDIWFNNAGIADLKPFLKQNFSEFEKVMNINFNSLANLTHFWMEKMTSRGSGTIVNIASMAGYLPLGGMSSYVASKHAVVGLTKSLQQEIEVSKLPVDLILVSPGFVETKIIQLGQKNGLPEKMKFLLSTPQDCAQEIVDGVKKKSLEITPTANGKFMRFTNRISPAFMRKLGKSLLLEALKKSSNN